MNTDALLERAPRPTSDYERLMDLFAELSARTGNKLEASLTLDESTFAALEADQRRPGKPHGEWVAVRDRVLVRFKRAGDLGGHGKYGASCRHESGEPHVAGCQGGD